MSELRQSEGALLDMDAVQAAVVAVDAHFPTSAAYGLLGESMEDGIRAFLAAQDSRSGPHGPAVALHGTRAARDTPERPRRQGTHPRLA
jgi:hypothetical protein